MRFILFVKDGDAYAELRADLDPAMTVLDALESLRAAGEDGAFPVRVPHYRHSCHHGSCGTCGAVVNGLESLMCLTRLDDLAAPRPRRPGGPPEPPETGADGAVIVRVDPIRRGALIGGAAARPDEALRAVPEWLGYLRAAETGGKAALEGDPTRDGAGGGAPERVRFEACIECGLCSSSCPVGAPFIGPAALAALNRGRERGEARAAELLDRAGAADGAPACERHLACSRVCPQAVYPGKHIQLLKNALAAKEP